MEHVRSFTDFPALAELQAFLAAKDDVPFETSELYSSAKDAKLVDLEKRKSIFRLFQDSELFDLVNQTVQWLNESDTSYSYQLHRDDITETRYEKGGFFLKHKDYLSVTSNLVEEFTLILCVTPSEKIDGKVVGGETLLFPYASKNGTAFDTTTPGHGLLFRKDLEHSGSVLRNGGEKHILTANLWATRKQTSDQVLFVTFPSNEAHENVKADDEALLKQATNQDTSFALPVDCLKGTMLETHVNFVNRSFEQNDEAVPAVVNYQCTNFTFEEFATVAKILQRAYVNEEAIGNHASCLDFFGPFEAENLLVNLALEKTTLGPDPPSCDRFTKSAEGEQKLPARKKNKTNGSDTNETKYDLDVIVCENESRTEVVNTVARQLGYDSYVPFKMVFVEGIIQHLPDCSSESISVTPVALLLGDYNHVFAIQKVGGTHTDAIDASTLRDFHVKKNYWAKEPDWTKKRDEIFDSLEWDISQKAMDAYTEGRGFSLKFALGDDENVRSSITSFVFDGDVGKGFECFEPLSHYSGPHPVEPADEESEKNSGSEDEEAEVGTVEAVVAAVAEDNSTTNATAEGPTRLFHRNELGKATFTWEEATAASDFIASMDIEERVKACIQKKRFVIPQESKEHDEYYCNDSVYSNLNILYVTGVVRLEHSAAVTVEDEAGVSFDAWPTNSQKKETRRKGVQHWASMGLRNYFGDDFYPYDSDEESSSDDY